MLDYQRLLIYSHPLSLLILIYLLISLHRRNNKSKGDSISKIYSDMSGIKMLRKQLHSRYGVKSPKKPTVLSRIGKQIVEENKTSLKKPKQTCSICLWEIDSKDILTLECKHYFHLEWMGSFVKNSVDNKAFPIKWVELNCNKEISDLVLRKIWGKKLYDKLVTFRFDK